MNIGPVETLMSSDIEIVSKIHAKCFFDAWPPPMMHQILAMPGAFGYVARRAGFGSAIGFALARVVADECELLSLGVEPSYRSQGIGAKLLSTSIFRAKSEKARWFFLEVAEDNKSALQLYRNYGLTRVGQRLDYYTNADGSQTNALTMRCALPVMIGAD